MAHYYEELKVWQKSVDFVTEIYLCTSTFPDAERYGLTSQMRRAAVSLSSNIAEGAARETTKDFLRFISISNGSLAEVRTQLIIACNLKFITDATLVRLKEAADEIGKMLHGLRKSLLSKMEDLNTDNLSVTSSFLALTTNY